MSDDVIFGSVDGVEVALGGVEVTANDVTVRLHGVPSDRTAQLDQEYAAASDAWAEVLKRSREEAGDAPTQPGTRVLTHLPLQLTDDLGGVYALKHGQSAGSGTEWLAIQRFEPAPSAEARWLAVTMNDRTHRHPLH